MDHLVALLFVLSCFSLVHGGKKRNDQKKDGNADVRDGEPSWCDQYKAYCEHLQVRTQCIKTCNATAIVDPSWCQNYKPYCKNNPSIESQCPLTCALAVNGNWGSWAMWAACSTSCGKGVQTRTRECNQPAPKNGGEECDMDGGHGMKELQSRECSADKCPNHGGYSAWSAYTDCSKSCGGGIQYKSRCCINPFPSNGGDDCSKIGPPVEAKVCNTMPCPIDGAYGEWSDWSECTATCGSGMRHKKRECQNPEPKFGGKNCSLLGPMMMSEKCNMKPCPIDGRYTDWTPYSKCSKTCGSGLQHRARCCVDPAPAFGGKDCSVIGEPVEVKICQAAPCPIDGNWSEWNDWGVCTNKCGDDGVKMRQRTCDNPKPLFGGKDCAGSAAETVECNRKTCAVDGGFTEWTEWSDCSVSCSTGVHTKTRSCTNPTPEGSGKPCSGDTIMTKPCADKACPINGNWGPWEAYGACSEVCGDKGIKMRSRICNNPPPMFGGATCAGDAIESAECNRIICKVDGGFSEWTEWGTCSATCGTSEKTRSRTCTNPAPANGGTDCSGDLSETSSCTVPKCPEYKYGLDMLSWDGAETACQTWGGHLASVHSQTEMDLIINGFSAAGVSLEADVYAWIGLNDKVIQGKWIWIGGTEAKSTYLPWGNGEPSQVDHHCVSTNLFAKTWWDRDCSTLYRYVCKK